MFRTRTFSSEAALRQIWATRPTNFSVPRKFSSGWRSAISHKKEPSPQPRSTRSGAGLPKMAKGLSGARYVSGISSTTEKNDRRCEVVQPRNRFRAELNWQEC
jgi:hypothetical protein